MVRAAADAGTEILAATPHLRPDFPGVHVNELAARSEAVRAEIQREGIPVRLVSGAEISVVWASEATDEELVLASYDQHGTDLLIETPMMKFAGLQQFIQELQARGYRITLGHPERSADFRRDLGPLRELVAGGVLLQINADSLFGSRATRQFTKRLLAEGLAHVIASDGHRGADWRPVTALADGVATAARLVGAERAYWLATAAPQSIVGGSELPVAPPISPHGKKDRLFLR